MVIVLYILINLFNEFLDFSYIIFAKDYNSDFVLEIDSFS